ncbi:hypothetical protein AVEN_218464-1 [Araneus ventricosus]|uniref:Uncharacterized protein n=1 Tax=Araneus ventricosus TaxID=182803 RepID=A0A4Y2LPV9_ARAVE|nr:hypothetical protein AVEN_218464-1 [Araneus ventricosus]
MPRHQLSHALISAELRVTQMILLLKELGGLIAGLATRNECFRPLLIQCIAQDNQEIGVAAEPPGISFTPVSAQIISLPHIPHSNPLISRGWITLPLLACIIQTGVGKVSGQIRYTEDTENTVFDFGIMTESRPYEVQLSFSEIHSATCAWAWSAVFSGWDSS